MHSVNIDSERCKGCGLCVKVCPKQCLSLVAQLNKAGYSWAFLEKENDCIACGFCYLSCPDVCIEVYK